MWLEKKKSTVKIKTKVMSWISLQAHNIQKAKEATDPQVIHPLNHTQEIPKLSWIGFWKAQILR